MTEFTLSCQGVRFTQSQRNTCTPGHTSHFNTPCCKACRRYYSPSEDHSLAVSIAHPTPTVRRCVGISAITPLQLHSPLTASSSCCAAATCSDTSSLVFLMISSSSLTRCSYMIAQQMRRYTNTYIACEDYAYERSENKIAGKGHGYLK